MLVVAILYPTIIGFTLQARGWHFSVTHPRPFDGDIWNKDNHGPKHGDGSGPNQWVTFSPTVLVRTVGSFLAYTLVHMVLAAQMRLRGVDPTAPNFLDRPMHLLLCWHSLLLCVCQPL